MSGMFGKNKRPLSDLLNPARRKGGTKGPPARRTKSFIHSLCTCPCLPRSSRAAFLVGWWWGESAGVVLSCARGRGWCPPSGSDKGCSSRLRSVALGSPEGRLCPDPGAPQPRARSGAMERSHRGRSWRCDPGKSSAPAPPRPGLLQSVCFSFSDVSSQGAVCVFGVFRCLVSLPPL